MPRKFFATPNHRKKVTTIPPFPIYCFEKPVRQCDSPEKKATMATIITFPISQIENDWAAVEKTIRQEFEDELSASDIDEIVSELKPTFHQLPAQFQSFSMDGSSLAPLSPEARDTAVSFANSSVQRFIDEQASPYAVTAFGIILRLVVRLYKVRHGLAE